MRLIRRPRAPSSVTLPSWWRRHALRLTGACVVLLGVVCARSVPSPQAPDDDWSRYHDRTFVVARVIDGDTLDIAVADGDRPTTRIRLWGVDAPETGHGGQAPMYFGREAAQFAEETLAGGRVHVVLSPKQSRDRFGRLLAYVFLEQGGAMFNERLIALGLAYADPRFPHHYGDRFLALENQARREQRGLWKTLTTEQMPRWRQRNEARRTADD